MRKLLPATLLAVSLSAGPALADLICDNGVTITVDAATGKTFAKLPNSKAVELTLVQIAPADVNDEVRLYSSVKEDVDCVKKLCLMAHTLDGKTEYYFKMGEAPSACRETNK